MERAISKQQNEEGNFFGNSTEPLVGNSSFFGKSNTTSEIIYENSPLDLFHSQTEDSDLSLNEKTVFNQMKYPGRR